MDDYSSILSSIFRILNNFQCLEDRINVAMPMNKIFRKSPFRRASIGPLMGD